MSVQRTPTQRSRGTTPTLNQRGTTPLSTHNHPLLTAPFPSLDASAQSQITDLVQRNRTLDHTINQLNSKITSESTRSKEAIEAIRVENEREKDAWKDGIQDLMGSWRIVQRRLELEIEVLRGEALKMEDQLRKERKNVQLFKTKLAMWVYEAGRLDRRLRTSEEDAEHARGVLEERVREVEAEMEDLRVEAVKGEKERRKLDRELTKLRAEDATLVATHASCSSKLERLQLSSDLLTTQKSTLTQELNDERKKCAELTRQVEHWADLEKRGAGEGEGLKERIRELEEELKEAKRGAGDAAKMKELEKDLNKEKGRVDKMKGIVSSWQEEAATQKQKAEDALSEVDELKEALEALKDEKELLVKENNKLEKRTADMKEDLENVRFRGWPRKSTGSIRPRPLPPTATLKEDSEKERARVAPTPPASRERSPAQDAQAYSHASSSSEGVEMLETDPQPMVKPKPKPRLRQVARKSTGGKPPSPIRSGGKDEDDESDGDEKDSDVEEVVKELTKKAKAKAKPKAKETEAGNSDVEEVEAPKGKARARSKPASKAASRAASAKPTSKATSRKRKASHSDEEEAAKGQDDDDDIEIIEKPPNKKSRSAKPASTIISTKPASSATTTTSTSGGVTSRNTARPASRGGRAASRAPSSRAAGGRAASKAPSSRGGKGKQKEVEVIDGEDEMEEGGSIKKDEPKKKKRKIGIFPTAPANPLGDKGAGIALGQFSSTLDIPTFLSPVRQDEHVPARSNTGGPSTAGAVSSALSGFAKLASGFGRR